MTTKILVACLVLVAAMSVFAGQTSKQHKAGAESKHPDLNGIWQAMNEAGYELEAHDARPAMAVRAGPYGPPRATPGPAVGAAAAVPPNPGAAGRRARPATPQARAGQTED